MAAEIEATFTDINKDELRAKVRTLGGELKQPELLMKRVIFDLGPSTFARVRDEGNCVTMSYKHQDSQTLSGMQEICLQIDDYDAGVDFLRHLIKDEPKAYQETLREEWTMPDGTELDIDTWPWIPSFVEIEGPSEEAVKHWAAELGFDMADAIFGAVDDVYRKYYDVTNDQINFCPRITFTAPPDWLIAAKRPAN